MSAKGITGITMGCPVGIGPEIILRYFTARRGHDNPVVVIGDSGVLSTTAEHLQIQQEIVNWQPGTEVKPDKIHVYPVSNLNPETLQWGRPTAETGRAMAKYIETGVELIQDGNLEGIVTCPIAKIALQRAGYDFPGHTEMLAHLTGNTHYGMMMAGDKLRVTLATLHCSFADIRRKLQKQTIIDLIRLTHNALKYDFDIHRPCIGVAALNPHAGEEGLFGREESEVIAPAVNEAQVQGIQAQGPFPADTIFHQAVNGCYDAIVCMYHDQGLIPFKLLHFSDGVNVTLGLPIVRTSVDHGTAYDIAGQGKADSASLAAAISLAITIVDNRKKNTAIPFS